MTHVSIIGTGNMGQALSGVVTKGGNTVEVFNQSSGDAPVTVHVTSVLAAPVTVAVNVLFSPGASAAVVGATP